MEAFKYFVMFLELVDELAYSMSPKHQFETRRRETLIGGLLGPLSIICNGLQYLQSLTPLKFDDAVMEAV